MSTSARRRAPRLALLGLFGMLASAAPSPARATPWSQGVPEARQEQANAIFEEGNQLFAQQAYTPALDKYRAAIAAWDHPLIRFNLAVTLIRLDRPLEAALELEQALRFGEEPFKKDLYQQALDYQALLRGRLGYIEASCVQAGAQILLDGKPWFACPGSQKVRVMAGQHALVGELPGHLTSAQRIVVEGGGTARQAIELVPLESAMRERYRFPRWLPYSVASAGAVIGLAGLAVNLGARGDMDAAREEFAGQCPNGCVLEDAFPLLAADMDAATRQSRIGVGVMVAGGAVLAGGIVMLVLNRPQRYLPTLEVAPGGGVTAGAHIRF